MYKYYTIDCCFMVALVWEFSNCIEWHGLALMDPDCMKAYLNDKLSWILHQRIYFKTRWVDGNADILSHPGP